MSNRTQEVKKFFYFLRRGFRQGTWPLLQKYVVMRSILTLPPSQVSTNSAFGVHCLINEADSLMLHWAIRSLLNVCTEPFQLTIHDDGTCTDKTIQQFQRSFMGAKIIQKKEAVRKIMPLLSKYPFLQSWWPIAKASNMKALDFYLLGETEWVVFLDSDVLFFDKPYELFKSCDTTVWMKDSSYMLEIPPEQSVSLFGGNPLPPMNAGLGRIQRSKFSLDLSEKVLKYMQNPRDDMTLHAVITAQDANFELLPASYDCTTELGFEGKIAKHYTNPFRFWLYEEGLPRIAKQLKLSQHPWLCERP